MWQTIREGVKVIMENNSENSEIPSSLVQEPRGPESGLQSCEPIAGGSETFLCEIVSQRPHFIFELGKVK